MKGAWAEHKRHLRRDLSFNNHVSDSEKVDEINKGAEATYEELMIKNSHNQLNTSTYMLKKQIPSNMKINCTVVQSTPVLKPKTKKKIFKQEEIKNKAKQNNSNFTVRTMKAMKMDYLYMIKKKRSFIYQNIDECIIKRY